ncbi:MAG: cell wall metabolism sensor histidine kinase WalK, partial [Verrucomicrobiota bacterium]|nr:cell wall metabolism sensor histidine kinase WalK [Verrucomicrobiota bacterium]
MAWVLAIVVCVGLFVLGRALWRSWVRPWRDVEQLVDDVINARAPGTFLVDGNTAAQRIGVALEDVFLRQCDLTNRARDGELDIRTILGAMRDGLAVVDAEGHVRLLNRVVRAMFAIAGEQLGERVLETFHDGLVADIVARTLRSGAPETGSINLRSGLGDAVRRVSVTSLPIADGSGEWRGAVVLFHDVTQLQQLEQVRREFVSNVSHELRTPLSIFRGYLET